MDFFKLLFTNILFTLSFSSYSQEVPILNYSTDINGQVRLEVASSEDNYYILNVRHDSIGDFDLATSMTLGEEGTTTIITEPLESYPIEQYQVLEYLIATPADTDGDGIDDITEFSNLPLQSPLNHAESIDFTNGTVAIDNLITFKQLSVSDTIVPWAEFLTDQEFVKFVIVALDSDTPDLYFINTETHYRHSAFMDTLGIDFFDVFKGEIVYYPTVISNNGTLGTFSFNYSFGDNKSFEIVEKCYELIAANMPFLKNNLSYFITENGQWQYQIDEEFYDSSRISILFEADVYADIDYLALNVAEGFGFFRLMDLEETPNSRDVVLYESLPNSLPRVGGIMTSVIQTPLSHVNLRAIQDHLPNAFIRDPLSVDSIANLIDKYVYYKVEQDKYFIREATVEEVNNWFEDIRPDEEQVPALNLTYTDILPLDEINFGMSDGFGAKCTNVATMRTFGFPEGTIPDGFGVPFYFYQEFMKYNGFFDEIETILADPDFQADLNTRIDMLKDLRSRIKDADMPQWILDELQAMHDSFPEGTSVRCRSSTNNEDLPGFSGAGLYTSKTQHPDEGHISKSIKQVYASMWNFRAYDERDFYRVDHYIASMGVLCHPNYSDEKANGVGVSTDPIYQTDNTFYLNTQVGEDLVTNPDALSTPEEILLDRVSVTEDDYIVIRYSSLVPDEQLIMNENYLNQMRDFLATIHDEFKILYDAEDAEGFAMDIEYKITSDDQLIIKQARPWASFWSDVAIFVESPPEITGINMRYFPNPVYDYLNIQCDDCDATTIYITNLAGQQILQKFINFNHNKSLQISINNLPKGMYIINGTGEYGEIYFAKKFFKK